MMIAFHLILATATWNLPIKTTSRLYEDVRRELIEQGWSPSPLASHRNCDVYSDLCADRLENDYCELTGPIPRCQWLWVRDGRATTVTTILDGDYVEDVSVEDSSD